LKRRKMTITDFLDKTAAVFPNKTGLVFKDKEYSYKEIKSRADSIAKAVSEKAEKQETVGLLMGNRPEMIFSYFGILKAGCIVLLFPANISDNNLVFQAEKAKPKFILCEKKYQNKLKRTSLLNVEFVEDLPCSENCSFESRVKENDFSTIVFTSGTTGIPKGVKLRHKNVAAATNNIIGFLRFNKDDIDVNASSLSHSFGLGHIHCIFAVSGTTILFADTINIKKIVQTIVEKKATTFGAVPAVLRIILDNYFDEFKQCGQFLRFVQTNTSSLEKDLIEKMFSALPNADFNYYYGLTEASRSTFIALNKRLDKLASVGQPLPGVEIKIINDEICIKGPHVADEYLGGESLKQGWLFTGDEGYLDKDNYLYFKSRKDDIINVGGEKVWPEEVERTIKQVPGVKDAAVVGVKDKLLGQAVKAFIVAEDDFSPDLAKKHCLNKLENYKVPRQVEIISQIPYSNNGKLCRDKLKNHG